jgi:GT2 family glycosyltransferase
MVFCMVEQFLSPDVANEIRDRYACPPPMPGLHPGCMLVRRGSFNKVGPFAVGRRFGEFVEWYTRVLDAGLKTFLLPEILYRRRIHTTNLSIRNRNMRYEFAHVLKEVTDRRRSRPEIPR